MLSTYFEVAIFFSRACCIVIVQPHCPSCLRLQKRGHCDLLRFHTCGMCFNMPRGIQCRPPTLGYTQHQLYTRTIGNVSVAMSPYHFVAIRGWKRYDEKKVVMTLGCGRAGWPYIENWRFVQKDFMLPDSNLTMSANPTAYYYLTTWLTFSVFSYVNTCIVECKMGLQYLIYIAYDTLKYYINVW